MLLEVLLDRLGLKDAALRAIAEIVHDIDLKDGKFGRDETAGIAHVISGICASAKETRPHRAWRGGLRRRLSELPQGARPLIEGERRVSTRRLCPSSEWCPTSRQGAAPEPAFGPASVRD